MTRSSDTPTEAGEGVDLGRRDALFDYVTRWGEGAVHRSRIPGKSEDQQYYVAVLPQRVGGTILKHAIADHTDVGKHAAYAWRAERGLDLHGNPRVTWEQVFAAPTKAGFKQLGAKAILHTDNLDDKVIEYITRPVPQLASKRYFFN